MSKQALRWHIPVLHCLAWLTDVHIDQQVQSPVYRHRRAPTDASHWVRACALQRTRCALAQCEARYSVSRPLCRSLECFAWVTLLDTATGQQSKARSASFALPGAIRQLLEEGMELGDADDRVRHALQGYNCACTAFTARACSASVQLCQLPFEAIYECSRAHVGNAGSTRAAARNLC